MSQSAERSAATMPPIVSIAPMRSPNPADRAAVGAAVRAACLDKGFMYIVDHGVPPAMTDAMFRETARFFALPDSRKRAVAMSPLTSNHGYEPMRAQVLEAGTPPDLKEGYYAGVKDGPNQWPADLPGFRETMEAYIAAMTELCRLTMQAIALSLELPEAYFDHFCDDPLLTLRLLHYPPQPANPLPDEKGCGAHTDWGAITYLLQDDAGGLQVWDEHRGWLDAPPVPGAYVLNLGDLIARWTNDRYRSTLHRVINASGRERYSVPFFYTGRADYDVICLPNCLAPGETPRYPPTTANGHLQEMYAKTYKAA